MRHTLLPLKERNALKRDYVVRLTIVFCFLLSTAILVGAAALFPAYMHATGLEQAGLSAVKELKASEEVKNRDKIAAELSNDMNLLSHLSSDAVNYRASKAIEKLVLIRTTVKLYSIAYEQQGTSTAILNIKGLANSRNDLLSFKNRIITTFAEAKVDLPLSELAKSSNIDFSMKITYKIL